MSLVGRILGLRTPEEKAYIKQLEEQKRIADEERKKDKHDKWVASHPMPDDPRDIKSPETLAHEQELADNFYKINEKTKNLELSFSSFQKTLDKLSNALQNNVSEDELKKLLSILKQENKQSLSLIQSLTKSFSQSNSELNEKLIIASEIKKILDKSSQILNNSSLSFSNKQQLLRKQQSELKLKTDIKNVETKSKDLSKEDKLDKQIAIAQKKKELLKLQKEIKDLEED